MDEQIKTQTPRPAVRIHPESAIHSEIERMQAFIELTEGIRPTKEQVCLRLMGLGLPIMKDYMKDFINA